MTLKGKKFQIFTDGGWSISGVVIDTTDKLLTIEDDDKVISIVWRDKISIAKILDQADAKSSPSPSNATKQKMPSLIEDNEGLFPMNDLNYTNTFFGIPKTLLKGSEIKEDNDDRNDFSISFSENENKTSGISFRSSDDSSK